MAKNSLLFLDKEEIEKLNDNEIKILINELREKEVKAIVLETDTQNLEEIDKELENINIVLICTDNLENAKIKVALEFYAYPEKELKIIGVVGTRGKTTTAFIIREILEKAGIRTGLITTMYTMIEDKIVMQNQGKMPRILDFFKILRVMSNESIMYVIMETPVSSIKEGLMSNINFAYTVFTNIIKEEINKDGLNTDSIPILSPDPSPLEKSLPEKKGTDEKDAYKIYEEIIKDNIEYEHLINAKRLDSDRIDEILDLILETVCSKRKKILIAGDEYPAELVKAKFMKLDSSHIEFVLDCMQENTTKIRNIKQYLKAVLFNAPSTIGNYYTALVNHDMYGGNNF